MEGKNGLMTHGNIAKQLIVFAIPLLVGNLFQQLDNYFVITTNSKVSHFDSSCFISLHEFHLVRIITYPSLLIKINVLLYIWLY